MKIAPDCKINDGKLCLNDRQEPFSISYISAIATASGYGVDMHNTAINPDRSSIDLSITQTARPLIPELKIQAKCTYHHKPEKNHMPFKIEKKNYDDIRENVNPHLLVIVHVPEVSSKWVVCNENSTILSHSCYFYSLKGLEEIKTKTKTLKIPLSNQLNPDKLTWIMSLLRKGRFINHDNSVVGL